jgi:hypothetical protein
MSAGEREEHREQAEVRLRRKVEGWVHHVAELDRDTDVVSTEYEQPVTLHDRIGIIAGLVPGLGADTPPPSLLAAERRLSPRTTYQSAPLSYLNAIGRSWSLWAESDRLEWYENPTPPTGRYGGIDFWFRNVTVGTTSIVTIKVSAGTIGQGVTGTLQVRSSDAAPRNFLVTGFQDHTLDLIVHPGSAFAVLVSLEPKQNISYLSFSEVTYQTL